MKKRLLNFILVLTMLVVMVPFATFSASAELYWVGIQGNRLNEDWFGTTDGMYILLDNGDSSGKWSSINRTIGIPQGVTLTIDMNGSILKSNVDGPLFDVYGTLILKNAGENNSHPGQAVLERFDDEKNKSNLITVHSTGRVDIIDSGDGANGIDIKNSHSDSYGGAVFVIGNSDTGKGGTFNLYDPKTKIFNCDENNGGGVYVQQYATFNMYAGTISVCKATGSVGGGNGGAVCNHGTFNMYGGTINDCTAWKGGGVYNDGTFNMYGAGTYNDITTSGATIQNCQATGSDGGSTGLGGGVYNAGTFEMSGGIIQGNQAKASDTNGKGGGVDNRGTFTMSGGIIQNNIANRWGGGVHNSGGSFIMTGGSVINNSVVQTNEAEGGGGGIYSGSEKSSAISNAIITGNTCAGATKLGNQIRGAITINGYCTIGNSEKDLYQVTDIKTNTEITFDKQGGNGGSDSVDSAVYNSAMPTVTVPEFADHTFLGYFDAPSGGTMYYNADGTSAKNWDKIVASTTLYAHWNHYHDGITFEPWDGTSTLMPTTAGNYYLTKDITFTGAWNVPSGTTNLCLNGHIINLNGGNNIKLENSNATLNLYDCGTSTEHYFTYRQKDYWSLIASPTDEQKAGAISLDAITNSTATNTVIKLPGGAITGGTGGYGNVEIVGGTFTMNGGNIIGHTHPDDNVQGGGVRVSGSGTFNMNGGLIAGCKVRAEGGGVIVFTGTFNMNGGTIAFNTSADKAGGGVYVGSSGTFNMAGGTIENCFAGGTGFGGGVYNSGTFDMSGGIIQGNQAKASDTNGKGGGVDNRGTFTMSDGIIQNNTANRWGGGVHNLDGTFTMTGGSVINNRVLDTVNNGGGAGVFGSNVTISNATITGNKCEGIGIGNQIRGNDNAVIKDYCTIENDDDNDLYSVTKNITKTAITFDKQGGTGGSGSVDPATWNTAMPTITPPTRTGYAFTGYFDASTGDKKYYNDDGTSAKNWDKIVASTTLYAQWTVASHTHSFTYAASGSTITATCGSTETDCDLDDRKITLTLTAPASLGYDGNEKEFTFADVEAAAWTGAGLELPTITYTAKEGSELTEDKAIKAGSYTASVTVDTGKTATLEFTITKATPTVTTVPTASAITYGQTLANSSLSNGVGSVAGSFAWTTSTTAPAVSDSETTEYEVTFTPTDTTNYNTTTCMVKLAVNKANASVTAPTANTLTYNGQAQALVTAGSTTGGTLQYRLDSGDYGATVPNAKDAGTYTVYYKVVGGDNYDDVAEVSVQVKINPKDVTGADVGAFAAMTYTGNAQTPSATVTIDGLTATGTWSDVTNVADTTTFTASGNFTGTITDQVTGMKKAEVTAPTISSKVYTGETLTADVDCTDKPYTLKTNAGGTAVGSYDVVLTLSDTTNYKWSDSEVADKTLKFQITKAENSWTTEPKIENVTYGTAISPVDAARFGTVVITYVGIGDTNYESSTTAPTDTGAYQATFSVAATDDCNGLSADVNFTISKKTVTVAGITASNKTYDGTTNATLVYTNITVSGTIDGDTLTATATGTFADANVGEGKTVTISGIALSGDAAKNYVLAASGNQTSTTANITKKDVTVTITPNGGVYGGTITAATAVLSDLVSGETVAPVLTYTGTDYNSTSVPTDAGTYTVTAALPDTATNYNLTGTVTAEFTVAKAGITPTVSLDGWTYGEAAKTPSVTGNTGTGNVTYTYKLKSAGDDAYTIEMPVNAGTYAVKAVIAETDDYDGATVTADFTIAQKEITVTAGTYKVSKVYDETTNAGTASGELTVTGILAADTGVTVQPGTIPAYDSADAKSDYSLTLPVSISGDTNGNYKLTSATVAVPGEITRKDVAGATVDTFGELTYTGNAQTPSATVTIDDLTATGTWSNVTNVADKTTFTANGNFTGTITDVATGMAKSTPDAPTGLTGVAPTTYGGSDGKITGTTTEMEYSSTTDFTSATACTGTETTGLSAGTYYVRVKATDNTSPSAYATVTVPEAAKENFSITITNYNAVYDGSAHGLALTGVPTGATVKYGEAPATCNQDSLTYTDFTYGEKTVYVKVTMYGYNDYTDSGSVNITKAALTAKADDKTVTYGDAAPTYTVSYSGWVKGEETPTTAAALTSTYTATSDVGEYDVTFETAPVFTNYTVTTKNGKVTVERAKTAVEPTVASGLVYSGNPQNGYTNAGTHVTLDGTFSATDVGENYSFTATPDANHAWSDGSTEAKTYNWSIGKAQAVITVDQMPIVKTYGEAIVLPTATSSFGEVTCNKTAEDLVNVGSYTVTYTVEGTTNYDDDTKTVSVTINQLAVNEPSVTGTYTYTGEEQIATVTGKANYMTESGGVKGTNAGDYTITYTLDGNHCWADGSDGTVTWSIGKADMVQGVNITTPSVPVSELVYTGEALELLCAGLTIDEKGGAPFGTFYYSVDGDRWSTDLPTAINAGEYNPVWYFVGDGNHNNIGSAEAPISQLYPVEISKGDQTVATVEMDGYTYGGTLPEPSISITPSENAPVTYYYSATNTTTGGTEWKNMTATTLNAGTYYLYAVIAATDNFGSQTTAAETFTVAKADVDAPAAGEGYTVDYAAEKITVDSGYEISKSTDFTTTIASGTIIEPGETYYIRKAADDNHNASVATLFTLSTRQAIPAAPELVSKTSTTITVTAIEGQEYSINGGNEWVSGTNGNVTFTGLSAGQAYSIITRKAATSTAFASASSAASVITTKSAEQSTAAADPVDVINGEIKSGGEKVEVKDENGEAVASEYLADVAEAINEVLNNKTVKNFGKVEADDDTGIIAATEASKSAIADALKAQTEDPVAKDNVNETGISKYLNVKLVSADVDVDTTAVTTVTVKKVVFDVTPMATITVAGTGGTSVTLTAEIANEDINDTVTFLLPVDKDDAAATAAVYHEDKFLGNFDVKTDESGNKYIEVTTNSFSEFGYITLDETTAGAMIDSTYYASLSDAVSAVQNNETIKLLKNASGEITVSRAVKFTVDDNGTTNTAEIKAGSGYVVSKSGNTYTVSAYSGGGGGGSSSYAVTVNESVHGSASADKKSASAGSTVTITVAPDKGFTLETLMVLDKNGKNIEVKSLGNNKYSFTMPSSKVTVSATFMEDNTMLNFFVDVKASDYYYDAVLWAAENGITKGTDAVHFSPDMGTTRAQVVTFLWRAAGSPEPKGDASIFTDVVIGSYYEKAVAWAIEQGITKGTSDATFSPDVVCTRGQIVTFLARFAGVEDADTVSAFTDVKTTDYFAAAVKWAKDNKVTEGTSATTFSPNADCTRAQVVTFLYRWMVK